MLATPDKGLLKTTPLFENVKNVVDALKPKLVILDPVGDLFGGDENRRADVRQFVAWFNGLAMEGDLGVVRAVAPLMDGQRAAIQRLGLPRPVGVPQQRRQVFEANGDVGVVRAVAPLIDGQRAAIQRLGLPRPVGVPQ